MNKWKKEIELIDNLGLLYPETDSWNDYDIYWNNYNKAFWVYELCIYNLNQRMPQLEKFIKFHNRWLWKRYKEYFNI